MGRDLIHDAVREREVGPGDLGFYAGCEFPITQFFGRKNQGTGKEKCPAKKWREALHDEPIS